MERSSRASANLASTASPFACQDVAASLSDVGRACRRGAEDVASSSDVYVASSSDVSSAVALRSTVAPPSQEKPCSATAAAATALPPCSQGGHPHGGSGLRRRRLRATLEEVECEHSELPVAQGVQDDGCRAFQLTEANLKGDQLDPAGSSSYIDFWQTRMGLLAAEPPSPKQAAEVQEAVAKEAAISEVGKPTSSMHASAANTSIVGGSDVGGSGDSHPATEVPEHVELWQRRLDIFCDSIRELETPCSSECGSVISCRTEEKDDFVDVDVEGLQEDLARWLSPEQLKSFGFEVSADHEKLSQIPPSRTGLFFVLAVAAFVAMPFLVVNGWIV